MKKARLQIDIYERGTTYAIVRHVFIGKTRAEAAGYFKAHMKTDSFLRGCTKRGKWDGLSCKITKRWR